MLQTPAREIEWDHVCINQTLIFQSRPNFQQIMGENETRELEKTQRRGFYRFVNK